MAGIPPTLTFQSLANSGAITGTERSAIRRAYERIIEGDSSQSAAARAKIHATAALEGVRATGEAGVVGALLGAAHAAFKSGLDVKIPGTSHLMPLDGAGALLGLLGGAAAANEPHGVGKTIANGGAACMAVFSFRKVHDLMQDLKVKKSGATPGGGAYVEGVDPKISKARFAGETSFGAEGQGWAPGSRVPVQGGGRGTFGAEGEDPIVRMARNL